jgi:RNA polymerase sigma-70 factor (ECF subfamily)
MTDRDAAGQSAGVDRPHELRVVAGSSVPPLEFRSVFTEHYAFCWRMLAHFGVPHASLDDAAQEVFAVVHRRLAEYDGRTSVRSWLWGIARRVASGHQRTEHRARRRLEVVAAPEPDATPDEELARAETIALVDRCLDALDQKHRDVFVLAEIEGCTAPEIANMLDVELNTVYSRLRNARAKFHRALERARTREPSSRPSGPGGSRDGSPRSR